MKFSWRGHEGLVQRSWTKSDWTTSPTEVPGRRSLNEGPRRKAQDKGPVRELIRVYKVRVGKRALCPEALGIIYRQ